MLPTLIAFIGYLLFMLAIGFFFMKRSSGRLDEYLLGRRGLGSWVTAMSAQASDMSGWLLMGLPGAIYMMRDGGGWGDIWCAVGLALGTLCNWLFVAPRLRVYSEKTGSMTIPSYLANRFRDPSGAMRMLGTLITLIFFTVYVSTGLVAAGKLFESMLDIDYRIAVGAGAVVILSYTFMGGYLAVCWTDLVQGSLMFFALIAAPAMCYIKNPSVAFAADWAVRHMNAFPDGVTTTAMLGVTSAMAWGLGYFGQPHILTRFMSISDRRELPKSTTIAMIWVVISLGMATVIALLAMPDAVTQQLWGSAPDAKGAEKIFIRMVQVYFNPWIGGVLLAALLSAIMSTIDSQLLVCSSTLTEDMYKCLASRTLPEKRLVRISRIFVAVIALVALGIALMDLETIFTVVQFAWGGFGAAFGPVILFSLYSRRMAWPTALAAMFTGLAVMLGWRFAGLSAYMYELLPGFLASTIACLVGNTLSSQRDTAILAEFNAVRNAMKAK
ncbi:MAG: sodium/proline symporter PutP [Kiritimatiellae bacterium]|nr:sodium/proline symporter PutP [Kiritimatiellia bacterium]